MSYINLYRKYRPNNFKTIIGQKHVVHTLNNALKSNKVAHAYIFAGPKGVGKTSIAKIFAKAINCQNLVDGDACNQCSHCQLIQKEETMDIMEIDAASNNGVDEIRKVIDNVAFLPSILNYKVFIIDEAHMLTTSAWNALLKTIEETPQHTKFIFATTELYKIPETILSRCQVYQFVKLTYQEQNELLTRVSQNEKIQIDQKAINKLIELADGSARDLLSRLDQVSMYNNNLVTLESINDLFGLINLEEKINLLNLLFKQDLVMLNQLIDQYLNRGVNILWLVQDLTYLLIDYLIYLQKKDFSQCQLLNEQSIKNWTISYQQTIDLINAWQKTYMELKRSYDTKYLFEILVFKSFQIINQQKENHLNQNIKVGIQENKQDQETKIYQTMPSFRVIKSEPKPLFSTTIFDHKKTSTPHEEPTIIKEESIKKIEHENKNLDQIIKNKFCSIIANKNSNDLSFANQVLNEIKKDPSLPKALGRLLYAKCAVASSKHGIIYLFNSPEESDIFNQEHLKKDFLEAIKKYYQELKHIIGIDEALAKKYLKELKDSKEQFADLDIEELKEIINTNPLLNILNNL